MDDKWIVVVTQGTTDVWDCVLGDMYFNSLLDANFAACEAEKQPGKTKQDGYYYFVLPLHK